MAAAAVGEAESAHINLAVIHTKWLLMTIEGCLLFVHLYVRNMVNASNCNEGVVLVGGWVVAGLGGEGGGFEGQQGRVTCRRESLFNIQL
ncbi:hypothetical protein E2C01_027605 [Portunus trituberculatus]|uniref:Uncharacterized protein n=1 Tax=Portunus trituberculatus TaxID=210409 RepID=A0A5B7EJ58_PORTR|nr:hypothetical protein [Portunus trituberculatus]